MKFNFEDKIVEIRNGDISCVHYKKDNIYVLTITKCGEMSQRPFEMLADVECYLMYYFGFNEDDDIENFNKIIVEHDDKFFK